MAKDEKDRHDSVWPHVMAKGATPNDGDPADLLLDWIPNARPREQVLVKNAERLCGFS